MKSFGALALPTILAPAAALPAQERPSVAPKSMQAVARQLATYTDTVLFGNVWLRPALSPRDRSLVTIAALAANGDDQQLASHIRIGLDNGLTARRSPRRSRISPSTPAELRRTALSASRWRSSPHATLPMARNRRRFLRQPHPPDRG